MYENLVRIKTYAQMCGVCKEMIGVRIKKGLVNTIKIDNTIFIVLTEEEMKGMK